MLLTKDEIIMLLDLLAEKYGLGYCMNPVEVGKLQAKLSIMLEYALQCEFRT